MRCNELSGFLNMLSVGVSLAKLALIEFGGTHTWVIKNLWPGLNSVEVAAGWLFVNEVQIIGKLFVGDLSGELCQRTIDGGKVAFIGLRVDIPIHS